MIWNLVDDFSWLDWSYRFGRRILQGWCALFHSFMLKWTWYQLDLSLMMLKRRSCYFLKRCTCIMGCFGNWLTDQSTKSAYLSAWHLVNVFFFPFSLPSFIHSATIIYWVSQCNCVSSLYTLIFSVNKYLLNGDYVQEWN